LARQKTIAPGERKVSDIKITDNFGLSVNLQIRDDSPLAKAKLTQLVAAGREVFDEFNKPVDQADVKSLSFGATATSPNLLNSELSKLTMGGGSNCGVSIVTAADGSLFGKDQFSTSIPIASNEAWLGVDLSLNVKLKAAASVGFIGLALEADATIVCTTYTVSTVAKPPLPLLRDACSAAFGNFSITTTSDAIWEQLPGSLNQTEASGSITAKVTLKQPYSLNPLASADLPFNTTASIKPNVTLQVSGSVTITGDLIFRCYKKTQNVVQIGVYKKHGSTFTAAFTAGAGAEGDVGDGDILTALLNAALPSVDVKKAGITGDNAKAFNKVIKDGLDRGLTAELNAVCSASHTDEAAVVYEVELGAGSNPATEKALKLALQGDWTGLETLSNARRVRNIVVETSEQRASLTLNLFGFYSATSVMDYLRSCTILLDESVQISIIDKLHTSRISAASIPYASDSEKLQKALMEDFLCTATYVAAAGKLAMQISAIQSYLDYQRNMSRDQMNQNVLLGYELGLIPKGSLDMLLSASKSFRHACIGATVKYDASALLVVFFSDPANLTPRKQDQVENLGRSTMCAFLDPSDDTDALRIEILKNSAAWAEMNRIGNTASFGTIPYLRHLGQTQLAAVSADWISIRWCADAISKVAPVLRDTVAALNKAPADPRQDPDFMKQRSRLANVLGAVTRNSNAAFVNGWGEALIFALSGKRGVAEMSLAWDSNQMHFPT
jgi:hypothetical protein